jgi:hypothetical protein
VVARWMSDAQAERLMAEATLAIAPPVGKLSAAALRSVIEELGDMAQVPVKADPKDKANISRPRNRDYLSP